MSSFVKHNVQPASDRVNFGLRASLILLVVSMLFGCATLKKLHLPGTAQSKPATPAQTSILAHHNTKTHKLKAPGAIVSTPAFEQDEARAMQRLAADPRTSLQPAEVGYYADVLQGRLKQVGGADFGVRRGLHRVVVDLSQRVQFVADSAELMPPGCAALTPLPDVFLEYSKALILVEVRAQADLDAGKQLALARATSIATCFTKSGVLADRIVVTGVKAIPAAAAKSNTNAKHATVELQLEPIVHRG